MAFNKTIRANTYQDQQKHEVQAILEVFWPNALYEENNVKIINILRRKI